MILAVCVVVLIFIVSCLLTFIKTEPDYKKAGKKGEKYATKLLKKYLDEDDCILTNCEIEFDGKLAELDNVIINKYGVFIVEVKNYSGVIYGDEKDFNWIKRKTTDVGNVYEEMVRNPIKQVKRQIYLLAKLLQNYGVPVWVKGYVLLINNNAPMESEFILSKNDDFYRIFHTKGKKMLDKNMINKITNCLSGK